MTADEVNTCDQLSAALAPVLSGLLTPALVIDMAAVEHNIGCAVSRFGADRWRPHVKTVKQRAVIAALLRAGVRRLKCATLLELELVLDTASAAAVSVDVLVAYPLHGPAVEGAASLAREHSRHTVRLLADDGAHARRLCDQTSLGIALDVDLGMDRTGAVPGSWIAAIDRAEFDVGRADIVHGYDGHHGDDEDQRALAWSSYDDLCEVAGRLVDARRASTATGAAIEVVTSGTHSYGHASTHRGLRGGPWHATVSPGTIVFSDGRSARAAAELGLRQAAFVLSRVVSVGADRVTLDAGSKAITPDGTPSCTAVGWPGLTPRRASEEHLPCDVAAGASAPARGDLVWLVPEHVCTTVNLHRDAIQVRGTSITRATVEARSRRAWVDDPGLETS